jgi:hypothetical protein
VPRYFFHLHDSIVSRDEEGTALADDDATRAFAIEGARSVLAAEVVRKGEVDLSGWIDVETGPGNPEFVVPFTDAVKVKP